jgi:hypothetical protein
MFLKLFLNNEKKEVPLERPIKSLPELRAEINQFIGVEENPAMLSFIDIDDDVIEIKDDYDFEYMLEQSKGQTVIRVDLLSKENTEINKIETSPKVDISVPAIKAVQEEMPSQLILSPQFIESMNEKVYETIATPLESEPLLSEVNKIESSNIQNEDSHLPNSENTLDFSAIKIPERQNFEVIDTKYDFTKQKAPAQFECLVEDKDFFLKSKKAKDDKIKSQIEESITSNPLLKELSAKIELLTDIVDQGFHTIKSDIENIQVTETKVSSLNIQKSFSEGTVHGAYCDLCNKMPIKGRRFKCLICPNFDLCESCEGANIHKHPMMVFYDNTDNRVAEEMTKLYGIKSSISRLTETELKTRILTNVAGSKYEAHFYEHFVNVRKEKSLADFTDEVLRIFG